MSPPGTSLFAIDKDHDMYWEVLADIFIEPADLILPGQDLAAPGLPGEDEIVRALASSPVRRTLDEGLCDVLFQEYREQRSKTMVIFLGVAMMMAGVWIDEADLRHLRRVARALRREPNGGYQRGKLAYGLRNVGQVQVAAAARHYEQGTPRKFFPCCFYCGKTSEDNGNPLLRCWRCRKARWCDETCKRKHAADHKRDCDLDFNEAHPQPAPAENAPA